MSGNEMSQGTCISLALSFSVVVGVTFGIIVATVIENGETRSVPAYLPR